MLVEVICTCTLGLYNISIQGYRKCVIPVVGTKLGKWYLVKHNCITIGVFSDYAYSKILS